LVMVSQEAPKVVSFYGQVPLPGMPYRWGIFMCPLGISSRINQSKFDTPPNTMEL
jgi:hypothetical protein